MVHRRTGEEEVREPRRQAGSGSSEPREHFPGARGKPDRTSANVPRWHRRTGGSARDTHHLAPGDILSANDVSLADAPAMVREQVRARNIVCADDGKNGVLREGPREL